MTDSFPTPTIGELLNDEFLRPWEMTPYRLSKELHVSTSTVLDLVHGIRNPEMETIHPIRVSA